MTGLIMDDDQLVMNLARWDPQKISKDPNSYEFAVREFQSVLNDENCTQCMKIEPSTKG